MNIVVNTEMPLFCFLYFFNQKIVNFLNQTQILWNGHRKIHEFRQWQFFINFFNYKWNIANNTDCHFLYFFNKKNCEFSQSVADFVKWAPKSPRILPIASKIKLWISSIGHGIKPHNFINWLWKNIENFVKQSCKKSWIS